MNMGGSSPATCLAVNLHVIILCTNIHSSMLKYDGDSIGSVLFLYSSIFLFSIFLQCKPKSVD